MERILQTKRLQIKIYSAEQIVQLFATHSKEDLEQRFYFPSEAAYTLAKEKAAKGYTTHRSTVRFFYLFHKDDLRPLGDVAFHNWYPEHRRSEIGYMLFHEQDKKQGFMFEAVQRILQYGFEEMNLNRVEACIGPNNTASKALILKLGFTQEGWLRQHYNKDGELQDSILYSLLKEESLYR